MSYDGKLILFSTEKDASIISRLHEVLGDDRPGSDRLMAFMSSFASPPLPICTWLKPCISSLGVSRGQWPVLCPNFFPLFEIRPPFAPSALPPGCSSSRLRRHKSEVMHRMPSISIRNWGAGTGWGFSHPGQSLVGRRKRYKRPGSSYDSFSLFRFRISHYH